jgi:hypothetical protein
VDDRDPWRKAKGPIVGSIDLALDLDRLIFDPYKAAATEEEHHRLDLLSELSWLAVEWKPGESLGEWTGKRRWKSFWKKHDDWMVEQLRDLWVSTVVARLREGTLLPWWEEQFMERLPKWTEKELPENVHETSEKLDWWEKTWEER